MTTATVYRIPRETELEGLGPFTVTEDGTPDTTFQLQLHAFGVRPDPAKWYDSETIDGTGGCVGVGTASAHWATLDGRRYRISLRDKESPAFVRVGVATLIITGNDGIPVDPGGIIDGGTP